MSALTRERYLPPTRRPPNECAGYVGYYCRMHLPQIFDLVDADGWAPPTWIYFKRKMRLLRFIEEKPFEQQMHESQWRVYGMLARLIALGVSVKLLHERSGVFTIYAAHRLVEPTFPIAVSRIGTHSYVEDRRAMDRAEFDAWLLCE